jgi:hypothetical protein
MCSENFPRVDSSFILTSLTALFGGGSSLTVILTYPRCILASLTAYSRKGFSDRG